MATHISLSTPLGVAACEEHAKLLNSIEDATKNAKAIQEKILADILSQNADTEYLSLYHLNGATDPETFKSKVPIITYEDIKPEIQRIANGDRSPILSVHPIIEFLTSSGTSCGERKLIPTTKLERDRRGIQLILPIPLINVYFQGLDKGKGLYFYSIKAEIKTPSGLLARPALTSYLKSEQFRVRANDPSDVCIGPYEAFVCSDIYQSMYTQMLCGLYQRKEVFRVGGLFASSLVRSIRFFQLNWQQLAHDIATGSLNPKITDSCLRDCMSRVLKPNPELARFITDECSSGNWEGIIARIWPNTKYVDAVITGSMAQYIPALDYFSGGLPLVSNLYCSSECNFGINLNPKCEPSKVSYTIMPNFAYFEFLPLEPKSSTPNDGGSPPQLVNLVDVEVGKEYEIVVTTYGGFYRYRVGDILRVNGFHNSAPQFQIMGRKDVLLSIDSDKTNEVDLQKAVENASELLREYKTTVVDYTSYADTKSIPGHYVIYWELMVKEPEKALPSDEVMEQCCLSMEESLDSVYRQGRVAEKSIGALEIRVVKSGTFDELMDYAISKGASINQYKVPRCIKATPILELLDSRVLSSHFSPRLPQWTPERRW